MAGLENNNKIAQDILGLFLKLGEDERYAVVLNLQANLYKPNFKANDNDIMHEDL